MSSTPTTSPAANAASRSTVWRIALLVFGVFAGSTAVIMIKASTEHPLLVASYRLLLAALLLSPLMWRDLRKNGKKLDGSILRWSWLPALALAAHFMTWVIGARATHVANASLIVNMTPVVVPFISWLLYRKRITRGELIGSGLALAGVLTLTLGSVAASRETLWGDLVCVSSLLMFALYMALNRKNDTGLSFWSFLVPLYAVAGLICLAFAVFFINPIKAYDMREIWLIIGLTIIPTIFGHSILNYSIPHLGSQVVAVTNLTQPLFAAFLGFLLFHEAPAGRFYIAAALILAGALVVIFTGRKNGAPPK